MLIFKVKINWILVWSALITNTKQVMQPLLKESQRRTFHNFQLLWVYSLHGGAGNKAADLAPEELLLIRSSAAEQIWSLMVSAETSDGLCDESAFLTHSPSPTQSFRLEKANHVHHKRFSAAICVCSVVGQDENEKEWNKPKYSETRLRLRYLILVVEEGVDAGSGAGVPNLHALVRRAERSREDDTVKSSHLPSSVWTWRRSAPHLQHSMKEEKHPFLYLETKWVSSGEKATFSTQEPCPLSVAARLACCLQ